MHLTVLAGNHANVGKGVPSFQCYYNLHDGVAGLEFGRTSPIPSDTAPPPPPSEPHASPISLADLSNASAEVITFADQPTWGTDAFGAFYCRATSGIHNEPLPIITVIFTRYDGMPYSWYCFELFYMYEINSNILHYWGKIHLKITILRKAWTQSMQIFVHSLNQSDHNSSFICLISICE